MNKYTKVILISGFALCLLYIWLPGYFITGDGPCHLYNARILRDVWLNRDTAFYSRFYHIVFQPNPNWLTTAALAALLILFPAAVAEKVFITLYAFLYVTGFFRLLRKVSGGSAWLTPVIFIFIFPHTLAKGFYNFSFSIALFPWVVWSWLRFMDEGRPRQWLHFQFLSALIFFTHLLAFEFAAFTCASLLLSHSLALRQEWPEAKPSGFFIRKGMLLALALAPFFVLMYWFTEKEGGLRMQLGHHFHRLVELAQFKYLVNLTGREEAVAAVSGIALLFLFTLSLSRLSARVHIHKYDGLILALVFVLFVYLFFPEDFLGRLILISMRVQLFVFLIMVCCVAYMVPSRPAGRVAVMLLFGCFVVITIIRIRCILPVSEGVEDYNSAGRYIKSGSVVLPLDFAPCGKDTRGNILADRNWVFMHALQYLGAQKPMVVLDNYEANMGYFPVEWNPTVNPYYHLGLGVGIEAQPPYAVIDGYRKAAGVTIDYIVTWCYDSSAMKFPYFRLMQKEIGAAYHPIFTSPSGRTVLLARNTGPVVNIQREAPER